MSPITRLVLLAGASVALAARHPHGRFHRHVEKRDTATYESAPYALTNGTATAGPTASTTSVAAELSSSIEVTSTSTQTLTSTITQTVVAASEAASASAVDAAASAAGSAAATCGATQYVTITESVTVTASAAAPETSSAEATSTVASSSSSSAAAVTTSSTSAAVPVAVYASSAKASTSSTEAAVTSASSSSAEVVVSSEASTPVATTSQLASSTSTTTSAAATSTSTTSTGLQTKRGCLYEAGLNECDSLTTDGQLSWIANWAATSDSDDGLTFVPQLWGHTATNGWDYTTSWVADCTAALAAGSPAILGFNEPDIASQADLSETDAYALWAEYISTPFASSGAILVSPSVTSTLTGTTYTGLDWLTNFAAAGATWDATGLHFYADCTADANDQLSYLKDYVAEAYSRFGKPIWVTEYGCSDGASDTQIAAFLEVSIEYLEGESSVQQYAAYKADVLAGNAAGTVYATTDSTSP